MAALSASKLVCSASDSITPTILVMAALESCN
jgi:hypothetical protein